MMRFYPAFLGAAAAIAILTPLAPGQLAPVAQPAEKQAPTPVPVQSPDRRPTFDLSKGVPLIRRAVLFGNPDKAAAKISPDGKHIAYLTPVKGVLNVWVGPADDLSKAQPVTNDEKRGIRSYFWAYTNAHILFTQDKGGDENWRIYAADIGSKEIRDLTPLEGVQARVQNVGEKFPEEILVALNDRNAMYHDLYRVSIRTGERKLVAKNEAVEKGADGKERPAGYAEFITDDDYRVRFARKATKTGGMEILRAVSGDAGATVFEPYDAIGLDDVSTTNILGFDKSGNVLYLLDARDRDTAALYSMDIATKKKTRILEDDSSDIQGVMENPITKKIEAAKTNYDRENWAYLDPNLAADFLAIRLQGGPGDWNVTSRSQDDRFWTVSIVEDDAPAKTCLLDRGDVQSPGRKPKLTTLFIASEALAKEPLTKMRPVTIAARDGMKLVSYLTLPLDADKDGKTDRPIPMVLLVHGGPWGRDTWGYVGTAQWLANRGYAVLQVNFRGSTGFGKKHLNAGNFEWAGKMHDDLIDAVNWAVGQKIADPRRIAIMGGSYGGYATLVGLTFTPDVFACGVDIVGPSNLNSLLKSIPPYWASEIEIMSRRVGDCRTPEGSKLLESRSPLSRADKIVKPLLIGQGANDPRVNQAEADQIVAAMTARKIPVTYVLYPDEGHGFARPPNRISFNAVAEHFLAKHLGGRAEPFGDALKGSTIQVPTGAEGVPGLADALASVPAPKKDEKPKQ